MMDLFALDLLRNENVLFKLEIGILTAFLCMLVWYFFFRPYQLFMDVSDLGFDSAFSQRGGSNHYKRALVNELRQKRKIGDLPPPYPNGWFAILESDELPLRGVKEVSALGLNLVAWRGESRQIYVADAYCPHLGAHLGVGGKVVGKECIQCPFHSWAFSGTTGKVENVPYSQCPPSGDLARLKMWPVEEHYGFVYLWYHANGLTPTWFLPAIPEIETGRWKYRGRTEIRVSCHVQEIPENGADVAHLAAVHSTPAIRHGMDFDKEWSLVKHVWKVSWEAREQPGRKHEALARVHHGLAFFNDSFQLFKMSVDAQQIGPGVVLLHFDTVVGRGVLVQNVTPLEPLLQRVTHRLYSAPTFIHPLGIAVLYFESVQITRDIRIWNRKCFLRKPVLIKEDHLINKFRRWYAQFYSEGSHSSSVKAYNGNHMNGDAIKVEKDIMEF